MKKKIIIGLILFLILAQFIRIDKTNPEVNIDLDLINVESADPSISTLLKANCYDCHSNESKYPWYTNVAPVSWWIKRHINNARGSLNFSEWANYSPQEKSDHAAESALKVEKKWMPISSYKIAHPEARMSDEEVTKLSHWFKSLQK